MVRYSDEILGSGQSPIFEFVILMRYQGAVDGSMSDPNVVLLVRFLAFKRRKNRQKRPRPRRVMDRFCRTRCIKKPRWVHSFTEISCILSIRWCFWNQHQLSREHDESITRLGWRLRRWFWRRLKDKTLTIQTTPKSALEALMAPSYDCFDFCWKFLISSSLFWWVWNGSTPVR